MLIIMFIIVYMIIFVYYCNKSYDNGYKNGVKVCIRELNKKFANDEDLSNIKIGAKIDGEEV